MTQVPAGWYPDPTAPQTDGYGRVRYWDGAAWTENVHMPAPAAVATYPAYAASPVPATPDGVPLAGWWSRVGAQVIDSLIVAPFFLLILAGQWPLIRSWFDEVQAAAETGSTVPDPPNFFDPTTVAGLAMLLGPVLITFVYSVIFLVWKQATPGQMALGLRVRLRDNPALPASAVLARVGFVTGLSLLAAVPFIGFAFTLVSLLNYLWPLWDPKRQALHDKVAGTNVVKVR